MPRFDCLLLGLALLGVGCSHPARVSTEIGPLEVQLNPNANQKVDLLFMVDNSNSMDAMQELLRAAFFDFFKPFDDLGTSGHYVDFQIGVITSDYGAGATGAPGCSTSPGGDQGRLQALGLKADLKCLPPLGVPFIRLNTTPGGSNNLPPGQDLAATFTCMASVGLGGCGFEHQLESVYAALHNTVENRGFVRPDAALAIAFLTNEDDASAPPDSDIFDKNKSQLYGFEDSYSRQTRFAVMCGTPPAFPPYGDSNGPLPSCIPAPNWPTGTGPGKQYDVQRYIDYFTLPGSKGGVKDNPADVILFAIDSADDTFHVVLSNPGTPAGEPYPICGQLNEGSNPPCVPVLQHSSVGKNPVLYGDPAVRLNTVVRSAAQHRIWSICDDSYGVGLQRLAGMLVSEMGAACLPDEQFDGSDPSQIECSAADVANSVDSNTIFPIPDCRSGAFPCWRLEHKDICVTSGFALGFGLSIDRHGTEPPPNTTIRASCRAPQ